jgi:hypothetical protein
LVIKESDLLLAGIVILGWAIVVVSTTTTGATVVSSGVLTTIWKQNSFQYVFN